MNDIAIKITGVKKQYQLGAYNGKTLQRDFQSLVAKLKGEEDPNIRLGIDQRIIGQTFMALNGINLEIKKGERLGIIGANGAGKSTLLKLLSRITAPSSGKIQIWGKISSMLEIGTGFHGEMTGRENIYMNGAILGMSKAEIDEKMEDIINFSEIRDFIDTPVKRYSSGMYVKLAFAVVAHLSSDIMIMDEVLAVGDLAFQNKCLNKMKEASLEEGKTVLYVSHNLATIRNLCSRCIVMDQGKIVFDGDTEEAISFYMNQHIEDHLIDVDLKPRSKKNSGKEYGISFDHLTILNKVIPEYKKGESIDLLLTLQTTKPMHDLNLIISSANDSDVLLGISRSTSFSIEQPGYYFIHVTMPIEQFEAGTFYENIAIVQNVDGRFLQYDAIEHAFRFHILSDPAWKIQTRGYMEFSSLQINSIKNDLTKK